MIGYDKEKISELDEIKPDVYEPVQPKPLIRDIIQITSLVSENRSFKEIAKLTGKTQISLKKEFQEMPSLPRPYDIKKYIDED